MPLTRPRSSDPRKPTAYRHPTAPIVRRSGPDWSTARGLPGADGSAGARYAIVRNKRCTTVLLGPSTKLTWVAEGVAGVPFRLGLRLERCRGVASATRAGPQPSPLCRREAAPTPRTAKSQILARLTARDTILVAGSISAVFKKFSGPTAELYLCAKCPWGQFSLFCVNRLWKGCRRR